MRIAILGSVALAVPPPKQGGTEWIAYYQAKGLGKRGHKVILFAARGSKKESEYELVEVRGSCRSAAPEPFRQLTSWGPFSGAPRHRATRDSVSRVGLKTPRGWQADPPSGGEAMTPPMVKESEIVESSRNLRRENVYLAQVIQKLIDRKNDYDVILNNMRGEAVFLPFANAQGKPFVNVMHLPIFPELAEIFKQYQTHIITISNAQRKEFPDLNYLATVGNCVDTEKYVPLVIPRSLSDEESLADARSSDKLRDPSPMTIGARDDRKSDYLLMMGTIGRHKNQGAAIQAAKKLGMKLILAGKIRDEDYYKELQKDIDGEMIRHIGEVGFAEKLALYQNAKAFIFPILWEEPFGLVLIEAMACGTPIVAFGNGAIPEVVADGETGFVVLPESSNLSDLSNLGNLSHLSDLEIKEEGLAGLVEAVRRIDSLPEAEYQKLRQNCRRHVEENFTVEKMVEAYEKALQNVI